jgi:uncharacterized membrane protein
MLLLLFVYVISGLLLAVIALPMIAGKIKPNPYYGFRVRETLENDETWYTVNRYAGKRLLVIGLVFAAAAIILYNVPGISIDAYAYACLIVFVIGFSLGMLQSWRYMNNLSK